MQRGLVNLWPNRRVANRGADGNGSGGFRGQCSQASSGPVCFDSLLPAVS